MKRRNTNEPRFLFSGKENGGCETFQNEMDEGVKNRFAKFFRAIQSYFINLLKFFLQVVFLFKEV